MQQFSASRISQTTHAKDEEMVQSLKGNSHQSKNRDEEN